MLGLWSYASASTLLDVERRARAVVATRRHTEIGHPHREAALGAKRRPAFPERLLPRMWIEGRTRPCPETQPER